MNDSEKNIVRGLVLLALLQDADRRLSDQALLMVCAGAGYAWSKVQIRHELEYLRDKLYIELTPQNSELWTVRLVAPGVDLLEGRTIDPAITVAR